MLSIHLRRSHLIEDTFSKLSNLAPSHWTKKFKIVYLGEVGIDSGGLTKDWFLEASQQLCNPLYCLFAHRSSDGTYDLNSQSAVNDHHLNYFYMFGRKKCGAGTWHRRLY